MEPFEEFYKQAKEIGILDYRNYDLLLELVKSTPNEPLFHWMLGYISLEKKNHEEANHYFQDALALDPNSLPAWGGLGRTYMDTFAWDEAEKCFRKRLAIQESSNHYVFLAVVLNAKKDIQGAIDACQRAIAIDPMHDEAYLNLGYYQFQNEQKVAAQNAFDKAIEIDPNNEPIIKEFLAAH